MEFWGASPRIFIVPFGKGKNLFLPYASFNAFFNGSRLGRWIWAYSRFLTEAGFPSLPSSPKKLRSYPSYSPRQRVKTLFLAFRFDYTHFLVELILLELGEEREREREREFIIKTFGRCVAKFDSFCLFLFIFTLIFGDTSFNYFYFCAAKERPFF